MTKSAEKPVEDVPLGDGQFNPLLDLNNWRRDERRHGWATEKPYGWGSLVRSARVERIIG